MAGNKRLKILKCCCYTWENALQVKCWMCLTRTVAALPETRQWHLTKFLHFKSVVWFRFSFHLTSNSPKVCNASWNTFVCETSLFLQHWWLDNRYDRLDAYYWSKVIYIKTAQLELHSLSFCFISSLHSLALSWTLSNLRSWPLMSTVECLLYNLTQFHSVPTCCKRQLWSHECLYQCLSRRGEAIGTQESELH